MADIDITCQKCGNVVTLSEFADPSNVVCRKCGEKLRRPEAELAIPKPRPTIRTAVSEESIVQEQKPAQEWRFHRNTQKDETAEKSTLLSGHLLASWAVFLVLAGLTGWLRYGSFLDASQLDMVKQYAPFVFLGLHVMVILAAFKYSVFQGVLSIMVPPYPYYFLLAVSDQFFMRAIVLGFLVGIGEDSFFYYRDLLSAAYEFVTGWIASGG